MNGLEAYDLYKSVRLHFNSESYDCFKYHFKAGSTSPQSFEIKKDRFCFVRLAKQFTREEYIHFLAANFFERPSSYSRELVHPSAIDVYQKRTKIRDSLAYTFKSDLEFLFPKYHKPDDLLRNTEGYPELLLNVWSQMISDETLIILNYILNLFPTWNKQIDDTIQWPQYYLRVKKYTPFLSFDGSMMKQILKDTIRNLDKTK